MLRQIVRAGCAGWRSISLRALLLTAAAAAALVSVNLGGCPAGGIGNPIGVTTGAAQNIGQARDQVNAGVIPESKSITVEGLLAEHDIPLTVPEDAPELYATAALAYRIPFSETRPVGDVFVNFGTTIDIDDFERAPQNLVVVIDRSGSMNDPASEGESTTKIEAVRRSVANLMRQLNSRDRVAIVSFGNFSQVDLGATRGDDRERVTNVVDRMTIGGETNFISGLMRGFEELRKNAGDGRANRVILFTDALPTAGTPLISDFIEVLRDNAEDEMYFTLMGLGEDYGTRLAERLTNVRGANAFYLGTSSRIHTIFNTDFDYLVTPAAFDVALTVEVADGIGISDVYGVPDYIPGRNFARIKVPTLFFSRREGGGAVVVRLTSRETSMFEEDVQIGALRLAFTLPDGTRRSWNLDLVLPAGISPTADPAYFSDDAARRAALLVDTALVLREAAESVENGRRSAAADMLAEFETYYREQRHGLSNATDSSSRTLDEEYDFIRQFRDVITSGYYGYYYY